MTEVNSSSENKTTKYIYNSLNQLKEVQIFSTDSSILEKTVKYFYDPSGRRISKSIKDNIDDTKSFSRFFVYDKNQIIAEYDGLGNKLASYTYSIKSEDDILGAEITSIGRLNGLANNSGKYYYLKDHLGTIEAITNNSGVPVQKYQYSAFGNIHSILDGNNNIISQPVVNTSFTFTGRELDKETGLMYFRARYYNPIIGRFIQQDSFPGKIENPVSVINRYSYVENNPIKFKDPSGKLKDPSDFTNVHGAYCGITATGEVESPDGRRTYITEPEDSLDWACMDHDNAYATVDIATSAKLEYSIARIQADASLLLNGIAYMTIKPFDGLAVSVGASGFLIYSVQRAIFIDIPLNFATSLLNAFGIKVKL